MALSSKSEFNRRKLRESLDNGEFFTPSFRDEKVLTLLRRAFQSELERLRRAPGASENGKQGAESKLKPSSSDDPTARDHDEVMRSLNSILALKWLGSNEYDRFTANQPPDPIRLTKLSWAVLRDIWKTISRNPADVYTLIVALAVNDLGKDPQLRRDVDKAKEMKAKTRGHAFRPMDPKANHDAVLYEAIQCHLIPCVNELPKPQWNAFVLGIRVGAELNMAQLAQGENLPGSLAGVHQFGTAKLSDNAFDMKYMEQLLDVAGAQGHVDMNGAKTMTESVFQTYLPMRSALARLLAGKTDCFRAYDAVLAARGALLSDQGLQTLSPAYPEQRALLRLLLMGRVTTKAKADWFTRAFAGLPEEDRAYLVTGLNQLGSSHHTSILLYYSPALISTCLAPVKDAETAHARLQSVMRFFARIYKDTGEMKWLGKGIYEFSLLYAKDAVVADPNALDSLPVMFTT